MMLEPSDFPIEGWEGDRGIYDIGYKDCIGIRLPYFLLTARFFLL